MLLFGVWDMRPLCSAIAGAMGIALKECMTSNVCTQSKICYYYVHFLINNSDNTQIFIT